VPPDSIMRRQQTLFIRCVVAVLMMAGFGCGITGAGDRPLVGPVLSINETTIGLDSITLQISNGNDLGGQTRCDISPSKNRSGPG